MYNSTHDTSFFYGTITLNNSHYITTQNNVCRQIISIRSKYEGQYGSSTYGIESYKYGGYSSGGSSGGSSDSGGSGYGGYTYYGYNENYTLYTTLTTCRENAGTKYTFALVLIHFVVSGSSYFGDIIVQPTLNGTLVAFISDLNTKTNSFSLGDYRNFVTIIQSTNTIITTYMSINVVDE